MKKKNILNFKLKLVRQIFEKYEAKKQIEHDSNSVDEEIFAGNQDIHCLERIENKKRLRCHECKTQNVRTDTSWWCPECENMPLCKNCIKNIISTKRFRTNCKWAFKKI